MNIKKEVTNSHVTSRDKRERRNLDKLDEIKLNDKVRDMLAVSALAGMAGRIGGKAIAVLVDPIEHMRLSADVAEIAMKSEIVDDETTALYAFKYMNELAEKLRAGKYDETGMTVSEGGPDEDSR